MLTLNNTTKGFSLYTVLQFFINSLEMVPIELVKHENCQKANGTTGYGECFPKKIVRISEGYCTVQVTELK